MTVAIMSPADAQAEKLELLDSLYASEERVDKIRARIEGRIVAHPSPRYETSLKDQDQQAVGDALAKAAAFRAQISQCDSVINQQVIDDSLEQRDKAIDQMQESAESVKEIGHRVVTAIATLMTEFGNLAEPSIKHDRARGVLSRALASLDRIGVQESVEFPVLPVLGSELADFIRGELQRSNETRDPSRYYDAFPALAKYSTDFADEEEA